MRKTKKQLDFFKATVKIHGGILAKGKRKTRRPLDCRKPIHVVLRSDKAVGRLALVNHEVKIKRSLRVLSQKFRISIYQKNINFNHIHLLIRGKTRIETQNFFRAFTAITARIVTGARKGQAFGKLWSYLLYTRLLSSWGKEFQKVKGYIEMNIQETLGIIQYRRRKHKNTS